MPTPRHGQILPPGAARRSYLRILLWALPAWAIFGLVVFLGLQLQPDQLILALAFWGACLLLTGIGATVWSFYVRSPHPLRRKHVDQDIAFALDSTPEPERDILGRELHLDPKAMHARVVVVTSDINSKLVSPER